MSALALPDLASAIDCEHRAAQQAARTALEHALECGRLLIEAKAAVGHGAWLPWLAENCTLRPRSAQAYMRLARELPKLPEANAQRVALLSVRDAIAQLASQARDLATLPAAAAAEVLDLAADGRLSNVLVHATNQRRAAWLRQPAPAACETVLIPGAPGHITADDGLRAALAAVIDRFDLPPEAVLETLNELYCEVQYRLEGMERRRMLNEAAA